MRYLKAIILFAISLYCVQQPLAATLHGKVDVAPAFFRLKMKEGGRTAHRIDLYGGRLDGTIVLFDGCGLCLRPFFQGGKGDHSNFWSGGIGIGHYTPITDCISLLPSIGVTHGRINTRVDLPIFGVFNTKERIRTNSLYLGLEACFTITPELTVTLIGQYAWSRSRANFPDIRFRSKGRSRGPNGAVCVDYYFTKCWSVNAAFGYNHSLDRKKFGIVGMGFKVGIGYLF